MKIVRIISEHLQKKSKGQVEAIVRLPSGEHVTRHVYPSKVEKEEE
jgi:hypothetical protein